MTTVTVYGKPDCQPCRLTLRWLLNGGVAYTYRDVTEDEAARDEVALLGYRSLPVVVAGDIHWSGFRSSKLERLCEIHVSAPDFTVLESEAVQYLADEASA